MKYEEQVRKTLCVALENPECMTADDRCDLAQHGLDSLNCMGLVIALEEIFDIEIPEDMLGMQFVRNIYDICKLLEEVTNNV